MRPHDNLRLVFSSLLILCLLMHGLPNATAAPTAADAAVFAKQLGVFGNSQPAALKASRHDGASGTPFALPRHYSSIAGDSGRWGSVHVLRSAIATEWNREAGHGRSPPQVP
jgi:hypothetical protein